MDHAGDESCRLQIVVHATQFVARMPILGRGNFNLREAQMGIAPEEGRASGQEPRSFDQLAAAYPLIFRAYLHPNLFPDYPIAERRFECDLGWYDIIDELSAWIESKAQDFLREGVEKIPLVVQCKEKFGSLRYYVGELPDDPVFRQELSRRIGDACERSCAGSK